MDAENDPQVLDRLSAVFGGEEKPEPAEASPAVEAETEVVDQAEDQPEEPESEEVAAEESEPTFELNGRMYTKAELAEVVSKGTDYTQKTQTVAEEKRRLEVERRLFQETQAFQQAASKEAAQLSAIDTELNSYMAVDVSTLDQETFGRMRHRIDVLRENKARLEDSLRTKQGEFKAQVYQSWDQMTESARKVITKELPDWDANATKIAEYALSQGFPFEAITGYDRTTRERVGPGVVDPAFAKALYKAWKWDQLQGTKAVATAKASKAAPFVKPGAATNNTQAAQKEDKALRQRVKQTGNIQDVARLLASRMR